MHNIEKNVEIKSHFKISCSMMIQLSQEVKYFLYSMVQMWGGK